MADQKFNPKKDKIAVVIKEFTMKKLSEGPFSKTAEPYIVSVAIDSSGTASPAIDFNILSFPNVRANDTISFDGQGHLVYGPKNPGEFVVYSILMMESDQDVRKLGGTIQSVLETEAVKLGLKAALVALPTYGLAITLAEKLIEGIAQFMKKNGDDELFRRNGTLLRGVTPAYDILRSYNSSNEYIDLTTSIIPLTSSNKLGTQTETLKL